MMNRDINNIDEFFLSVNKGKIYNEVISHIEKALIEKALEYSYGNQVIASKLLGLNRNTLHSKIAKLHIDPERFK